MPTAGVVVYFGSMWLLSFLILEVIGPHEHHPVGLVLLAVGYLGPIICAVLAAMFVGRKLRRRYPKPEPRGFTVVLAQTRGGPPPPGGCPDYGTPAAKAAPADPPR